MKKKELSSAQSVTEISSGTEVIPLMPKTTRFTDLEKKVAALEKQAAGHQKGLEVLLGAVNEVRSNFGLNLLKVDP